MVNLLPPKIRGELIKRYKERRLTVLSGLVLVVLLIGIVLLASFLAVLSLKEASLNELLLIKQRESREKGLGLLTKTAEEVNRRSAVVIKNLGRDINQAELFGYLTSLLPVGVKLNSLSYLRTGEEVTVSLNGVSTGRQAMKTFIDRLEADKQFALVETPITSLIRDTESGFSIKLTLAHEK